MKNLLFKILFSILCSNALCGADWFAYVTTQGNRKIVPINLRTNTRGPAIDNGGIVPGNIAITPDALKAYVPNPSGGVTAIDIPTNTAEGVIPAGDNPIHIAITPDGTTAFVTNNDSFNLSAIDIATNTSSIVFNFGPNNKPNGIAITPNGESAYIAFDSAPGTLQNKVVQIDLNTFTFIGAPIPMPVRPLFIGITPDGKKAYVTCPNSNVTTPIDLTTNTPLTPIPTGIFPRQLAITSNGKTVFVTNFNSDTVTPIDVATDVPGAPIHVGNGPVGVFVTPDSKIVYVANLGTDNVSQFLATFPFTPTGPPVFMGNGSRPFGIAITPDQAPTASFIVELGRAGSKTVFDASSSFSPVGSIARYAWNFGDGHTAVTSKPRIKHTYRSAGNFKVTLIVTNSAGTSTRQTFTGRVVSNNGGPSARTSKTLRIPRGAPLPPSEFRGKIQENRTLNQSECILKATWRPSPSPNVLLYRIFQDGKLIATSSAAGPFSITVCLNNCSTEGIKIAAVGAGNQESKRVKIKISSTSNALVKRLKDSHLFD